MLRTRPMRTRLLRLISLALLPILLVSCFPRNKPIEPKISYETRALNELKSPFPALLPYQKQKGWGQEYAVGVLFASEGDYYRAITSFKRALFEQPPQERKLELLYFITLCYSLSHRYQEALDTFENSALARIEPSFPAYRELLILLYEAYVKTCQCEKAEFMLQRLQEENPETAENVKVGTALELGNLSAVPQDFLADYCRCRKSIQKAQMLSAILPGAGYLYVGQKTSALTAFLLNALFIWGTVEFFRRGYYAAAIFTLSLESGWYFGGIWGAAEAAHFYNTRLYENMAKQRLNRARLYPLFQLRYSF